MALQVWLPLNGSLENKGLSGLEFSAVNSTYTVVNESGKIGKCYENTSNTAGGLISDQTIDLGQNQSMFCWVKLNSFFSSSSLTGILGQHRYGANRGMGITMKYVSSSSGYLSVNTGDGTTRTYNTYCGGTLLNSNVWYHVGYTYDGTTIKLFVNGNLDGTFSYSNMLVPEDYLLLFGWSLTGGKAIHNNYLLNGTLNDVRIYDHCLSAKEVKEISKGLILHYKLDDILGENLLNYSRNISNGWGIYAGVSSLSYENGRVKAVASSSGVPRVYNKTILPYSTDREYYTIMIDYDCSGNIRITGKSSNSVTTLNEGGSQGIGTVTLKSTKIIEGDHKVSVYEWYRLAATDTIKASWWMISFPIDSTLYINSIKVEKGINPNPVWSPADTDTEYDLSDYCCVHDCSGFGNNGNVLGSPSLSSDSPRYSVSTVFDGASAINAGRSTFVTDQITQAYWVYRDNWTTWYTSVGAQCSFLSNLETGGVAMVSGSKNTYNFLVGTGTSSNTYYSKAITTTLAAGWHHFAITWDGYTCRGYIDGQLSASSSTSSTRLPIFYNKTNTLWIGAEANSSATKPSTYSTGKMSDVRIYSTALSAEDILELYNTSAFIDNKQTLGCYEISESKENLLKSELLKPYLVPGRNSADVVMRNGVAALDLRPQPFYVPASGDTAAHSAQILANEFKPNTRYIFDMYFDSDDSYYAAQSKNVPGGIVIHYSDGSQDSSIYNTLGNKDNPIGWQHKVVITPADKSVSYIYLGYYTNTPVYYRFDSTISEYTEPTIGKNGVATSSNTKEVNEVQVQKGGNLITNNIIEI